MTEERLISLLKTSILIGFFLILLGVYFHLYSDYMESLGVTGIIISAVCIAIGMVFSLPTKIYLTIVLMRREAQLKAAENTHENINESAQHTKSTNNDKQEHK